MPPLTALLAALALAQAPARTEPDPPRADPARATRADDGFKPDPAWKPLGADLWFDPAGKRLVVRSVVALQDGILEMFVCRKGTKEHESILATAASGRSIHAGLLLCGAEPGRPVRFAPEYEPPKGTPIGIEVEWDQAGKTRKVDARDWIKEAGTNKPLTTDWVFAGSELFEDPRTKQMIYAADDGDLICTANFASALLDLPFRSSASDADRSWAANPDRVPPKGTPVTIYLKPRPAKAR